MNSTDVLRRLRLFLLVLAGLVFAGALFELVLSEHTETLVQWIPFILSGLGIAAILAALISPQRLTLIALRLVMVLVVLGSLLGVYEHLVNNIGLELEIRPNATVVSVFMEALKGASPLLAPGMLAVAAIIAIAATYYHPALLGNKKS